MHRTVNTAAVAGSDDDWTKFNPWRAPGSAPVYDPCGRASGGESGKRAVKQAAHNECAAVEGFEPALSGNDVSLHILGIEVAECKAKDARAPWQELANHRNGWYVERIKPEHRQHRRGQKPKHRQEQKPKHKHKQKQKQKMILFQNCMLMIYIVLLVICFRLLGFISLLKSSACNSS